jgi:hypothetical protein
MRLSGGQPSVQPVRLPGAFAVIAGLGLSTAACELSPAYPVHPPVVQRAHLETPSASVIAPTPTPAGTPPQALVSPSGTRPVIDRCHTGQLGISFAGSLGAAGTIVDTFRLANQINRPCWLYGFVGMQMLDQAGKPLTTVVVRNGGLFSGQAGATRFTLQPATSASFRAAWSDVPHGSETTCPQANQLQITPPDEFEYKTIPVSWAFAPCGGGEIDVTPARAAGVGPD